MEKSTLRKLLITQLGFLIGGLILVFGFGVSPIEAVWNHITVTILVMAGYALAKQKGL